MTTEAHTAFALPRTEWPRCLMALPASRVETLAEQLANQWAIQDVQIPQSGLGLVQLNDGAFGEGFFLGEAPFATARIRITTPDGVMAEGASQLLDDRSTLARSVAILDAVLSARLEGHESAEALVLEGLGLIESTTSDRRRLLASTRVDFSLLGAEDDDHD